MDPDDIKLLLKIIDNWQDGVLFAPVDHQALVDQAREILEKAGGEATKGDA